VKSGGRPRVYPGSPPPPTAPIDPAEALLCATRNGGAVMTMGRDEKLGEIREGYLADLLVVDGDPVTDFSVLLNPDRLVVIMKDGKIHKKTSAIAQHRVAA
jgi:imidazolonepropionase-like amidohydrolase